MAGSNDSLNSSYMSNVSLNSSYMSNVGLHSLYMSNVSSNSSYTNENGLNNVQGVLDLFDTEVVNPKQSEHLEIVTFMIILIPVVNLPIIRSIKRDKTGTFINQLVILHCINALCYVPILLEFFK